jgi:hypothetical protein
MFVSLKSKGTWPSLSVTFWTVYSNCIPATIIIFLLPSGQFIQAAYLPGRFDLPEVSLPLCAEREESPLRRGEGE